MTPARAGDGTNWEAVRQLLVASFAYMEPRLGHPSRAAQSTASDLADEARQGTCWIISDQARLLACLFTRPSRDHPTAYYLKRFSLNLNQVWRKTSRQRIDVAPFLKNLMPQVYCETL